MFKILLPYFAASIMAGRLVLTDLRDEPRSDMYRLHIWAACDIANSVNMSNTLGREGHTLRSI